MEKEIKNSSVRRIVEAHGAGDRSLRDILTYELRLQHYSTDKHNGRLYNLIDNVIGRLFDNPVKRGA